MTSGYCGTGFKPADMDVFHKFLSGTPCCDCRADDVEVYLLGNAPRCIPCFRAPVTGKTTVRLFERPKQWRRGK